MESYLTVVRNSNKNTARVYEYYLKKFRNYLYDKYAQGIDSIINEILQHKIDTYELLAEYTGHLINHKLSNKTISDSVKALRGFMAYCDVEITNQKFRHKVKLPKVIRREKKAIDRSDIVKILTGISDLRLRTYVQLVASTGMRATEATSIRLKDIEFDKEPIVIHLRGEFTKTKVERHVYLTKESADSLKQWIDYKYRVREVYNRGENGHRFYSYDKNDEHLLFSKIYNSESTPEGVYTNIRKWFSQSTDRIKLTNKMPGNKSRVITIKTLRDFAKSAVADATNTDYSEWFIGHAGSTYYNKKEIDRIMLFRKAEPSLTFFTLLDAQEQQFKDMQIQKLTEEVEKLRNYQKLTDNEIEQRAKKFADDIARDKLAELVKVELPRAVKQEIDLRMTELLRKKNIV